MTLDQLKEIMKFHLKNFNDEGVEINDNTLHNTVLSDSDGYGASNSKSIYRSSIRWSLKKYGHSDKPWPSNWMSMRVNELAENLI